MSTKKTTAPRNPDALTLLRTDHAAVLAMFEKFDKMKSDGPQKKKLVDQICDELTIHTTLEEEILYPAARGAIRDEDLMDEADIEHEGAKNLIAQLRSANPGDDHYDAKVTVLGEGIKHHVKEEHGEMFPKIKKSKLDTKAVGAQMAERKSELKAAARRT
jgi:hemerythrin superfamily protein